MNSRAAQLAKNAAFAALAAALFFALAEGAIRLFVRAPELAFRFPESNPQLRETRTYVRDPDLFWRLRPGVVVYEGEPTNAEGFRGPSLPPAKPPGTFRVAALGDSCTYGIFIPRDAVYVFVAQRRLAERRPGLRVEALDAGVPGYTSLQAVRYLERDVIRYRPDVVTFYLGYNDGRPAVFFSDREQTPARNAPLRTRALLRRSRVYQIASAYLLARRAGPRVDPRDYRANLEELIDFCRREGARPVLFTYPNGTYPSPASAYNPIIQEVGRARGVPVLDLEERMRPYEGDLS